MRGNRNRDMNKNKHLVFICFLNFILFLSSRIALAQSEMDLLLNENKSYHSYSNKANSKKANNEASSFTDLLSESLDDYSSATENNEEENKKENETVSWLKSLFNSKKNNEDKNIKSVSNNNIDDDAVVVPQKSNAAYFDISGVKLRMKPEEIEKILKKQGYRKISESFEIPNFIEWRAEELCRINGVIGFERLRACSVKIAQHHGHQFINRQLYNRYNTRESIEVNYTSTFTDNVAYRIYYKSDIPFSDSKSSKNVYINNIKIYDFWKRIDLKYGEPDNITEIKWGFGGKKPFLQAKTGQLVLMDPLVVSLDTTRMFNEDSKLANTDYYTF